MVHVVAAIIERDGFVLIARRPEHGRHPGRWEFPGGKVEPGESTGECAARELREEMEVEVGARGELAVVSHSYPEMEVELHAVRCELLSGEPGNIGCAEYAWVKPRELTEYDLLPPDKELAQIIFPSPLEAVAQLLCVAGRQAQTTHRDVFTSAFG